MTALSNPAIIMKARYVYGLGTLYINSFVKDYFVISVCLSLDMEFKITGMSDIGVNCSALKA